MKLLKFLRLPTPEELGHKSSLPSRFFHHDPGDYTWEDYHEEMERDHPIKWFFSDTLYWFLYRQITCRVKRVKDWILDHTTRRYHMLDLRQKGEDAYRHGWLDSDRQMLYALFNILVSFCEEEVKIYEHIKFFKECVESDNDDCKANDEGWLKSMIEVKDLYEYWTIDRPDKEKLKDAALHEWYEAHKACLPEADILSKKHRDLEEKFEKEEEEMLIRIIKVRGYMWT